MHILKLAVSLISITLLVACSASNPDVEGKQFVSKVIAQQKDQWDAHKLSENMDPTGGVTEANLSLALSKYAEVLGSINSSGEIKLTSPHSDPKANVPDERRQYSVDLACSKAPATLLITVARQSEQWHILGLEITSAAFKDVDKKQREGAQKFLDEVTMQICKTWSSDLLLRSIDSNFSKVLSKQSMMLRTQFFTAANTLGSLKSFSPVRFKEGQTVAGKNLYSYLAKESFEKGNAEFYFTVSKIEGKWEIGNFQMQIDLNKKSK